MIGLISSVSLQSIKAVGRSDIILKIEIYKKPAYILLLILGSWISPLAVAVTMLVYSIYSTVINGVQLSAVLEYTLREQVKDMFPALGMSAFMAMIIYPLNWLNLGNVYVMFLQVLIGMAIYLLLSVISRNESYADVCGLIKGQLK